MNSDLRCISILDAPSNLGLKPPAEGKEPGVKWMAEAIRSRGLVQRLGAIDAGKVEAPHAPRFSPSRKGHRAATMICSGPRSADYARAMPFSEVCLTGRLVP